MGVPGLFSWLMSRYPHVISKNYKTLCVNNLYIDTNSIIHAAAQHVFNYGSNKMLEPRYPELNRNQKVYKLFELYFDQIINITRLIDPTDLLFISVDGVAPLSKQMQQKQRRHISARQRDETIQFSSSCITPGTGFMHELSKYINYRIRSEMNTRFKHLKVIYSSYSVPGEGEHKILNYIRKYTSDDTSHCIVAPDADLILLALGTCYNKMYVLREDLFMKQFDLINISLLKQCLVNDMWATQETERVAINDFLLLCILVGNDFLPRVQMLHNVTDGINLLLNIYNTTSKRGKYRLCYDNAMIHKKNLKFFIQTLSNSEQYYINEQLQHAKDATIPGSTKSLLQAVQNNSINLAKYKASYYESYRINDVATMIEEYYKGLQWVMLYYTSCCPDKEWMYTFYAAPFMTDFATFNTETKIRFNTTSNLSAFLQLVAILPYRDRYLVPQEYHCLIQDTTEFDIEYDGKTKEYEGIAILPFIDNNELRTKYDSIVTTKTYNRNKTSITKLFTHDDMVNETLYTYRDVCSVDHNTTSKLSIEYIYI